MVGSPAALGGFAALIMCSANLPDKIAVAIDVQLDDGNPATGTVRAQQQTAVNQGIANASASSYQETGTNVYVLCRQI